MPKPPEPEEITTVTEEKHRVIVSDEKSRRIIFAIGKQHIAFDIFSRVTQLPPGTGDQPAPVLPMEKRGKRNE